MFTEVAEQALLVVALDQRSIVAVHEKSGSFHPSKCQGIAI